ncbi:MAG: DNA polymerase III subunit beta [Candidatus Moraniibacteriota bacterium]|nr:MAG: DNA polymerase III subunit beta [Candidatus Moranbacteria bacterium]
MKAVCTYENLKGALQATEFATSKSATLSILNNILIETDGGQLCFSATNLEIGIVKKIQAKIDAPGKIVVSASLLGSFLTALRGTEHVKLSVDGRILTLESGAHKAKINGYDVDDFPIIPQMSGQSTIDITLAQFKESIAKVLNFTSRTETRIELTGVFMSFQPEEVCSVATDSFRLGEMCIPKNELITRNSGSEEMIGDGAQIILPQQLCAYISKFSDDHETIQCAIEENHLFFVCGDLYVTARLIDGAYPDYKQIIPESAVTKVLIKKDALLEAMKVTTVFTGRESGEIHFDIGDTVLKITTKHQEIGENTTELDVQTEGPAQKIVLNPRFVIDGVNRIDEDTVEISINGNAAPVMFRGTGDTQSRYTYIVMPVKSA